VSTTLFESSVKLLHALLITQISKEDYSDFQRFLDFFRNLFPISDSTWSVNFFDKNFLSTIMKENSDLNFFKTIF